MACGVPPRGCPTQDLLVHTCRKHLKNVTESGSLTGTGNPEIRKIVPLLYENHTFIRNVTILQGGEPLRRQKHAPPGDPRNSLKFALESKGPLWAPRCTKKRPGSAQWRQRGRKWSPKALFLEPRAHISREVAESGPLREHQYLL